MDKFSIKTPLTGEYFTTVRLTTGGVCALAGFDVDTAEDFKVCVTESLLILKRNGFSAATIEFSVGEALGCSVVGEGAVGEKEASFEDEISHALLSALLGKVELKKEQERVVSVAFEG